PKKVAIVTSNTRPSPAKLQSRASLRMTCRKALTGASCDRPGFWSKSMNIESPSPSEVERDRQRLAQELAAESGEDWAEGYRPGSAGCHELLDRTALLTDMLERYLL